MKKWHSALISLAGGAVLAVAVMFAGGIAEAESNKDVLRLVCDGFFVAGALLLMFGGLRWTYNGGVMDGLGYSAKLVINRMRPHYEDHRQSFAEYREKRESKARSPFAPAVSGLVLTVIALVLYAVYSGLY